MRLSIALIVWIAAVIGAVAVGSAVQSSVGSRSGGGSFDASAVRATDPDSLFRTANLTHALSVARARLGAGARLDNFALYPGYLSVTAVRSGGEVDFNVNAAGTTNVVNTPGNPGSDTLFSLARADAGSPAVLARRISNLAKLPETALAYMVLEPDPVSGHLRWLVYPRQGTTRVEYLEAAGARAPIREQLP